MLVRQRWAGQQAGRGNNNAMPRQHQHQHVSACSVAGSTTRGGAGPEPDMYPDSKASTNQNTQIVPGRRDKWLVVRMICILAYLSAGWVSAD